MFEMKTSNTDPADVASIDAIITAAYDSISGLPGKRDWNRVLSLSFQLQMVGTCVPRCGALGASPSESNYPSSQHQRR